MNELKVLFWLIGTLFKLIFLILRTVFRLIRAVARAASGRVRAAREGDPGATAPLPARGTLSAKTAPAAAPAADRAGVARLTSAVGAVSARARPLAARCDAERLCEPLRPTLRDFVLPRLQQADAALRGTLSQPALARLTAAVRYLDALTGLLEVMADQRRDPALDELVDDADTLAAACYQPILDYCRNLDIPLSSDRTATLFGDGCSPALGRIDDPTGLAILHLPWEWLQEVHRWPAIGHEVGHDFYDSVRGLDQELLRRSGLAEVDGRGGIVDGDQVTTRDVARIVRVWRHELVADAFGAMMLGPAYAVATAAIFASPDDPRQALAADVDGNRYEDHPPGHVRVAAVCRLLANMGFGALCEDIEKRWRARHGDPGFILLPTTRGFVAVDDQPFIEQAVALTTTLQREGHAALKGVSLYSIPGFDFGPREHVASQRIRDAFLASTPPGAADARLLVAGAVLAWAQRPKDGERVLRAARLAVGKLALPVPQTAGARAPATEPFAELLRDAFLLDLALRPPRTSRLRR